MTLWVLSVLTLFAVYLGQMIQQRILVITKIEDNEELHFIAEAGVKRALAEFAISKYPSAFSSLNDKCTNNPVVFRDIFLGKGNFSVLYDYKDRQDKNITQRFGLLIKRSSND